MDSLPPELVLDILDNARQSVKAPRRLLKRCSLVNRLFRNCAQHLLFKHYSRIRGIDEVAGWLAADASEATESLQLRLPAEKGGDEAVLAAAAREQEELLVAVLTRPERLKELELHLTSCVLTSVLSLSSLHNLECLKLTADHYHDETGFVEGAAPPAFQLHSLEVDPFVSPRLLDSLLPALSSLRALTASVHYWHDTDPIIALASILEASNTTLDFFSLSMPDEPVCIDHISPALYSLSSLSTFEWHGAMCECCDALVLPSLPSSVKTLVLDAAPYDAGAFLVSDQLLAEEPATTINGELLLPNLETLGVPSRTKKTLARSELQKARLRGIEVKGVRAVSIL
ncbi:hypothetical protein JCM8547_009227 [Rhodosporidiobolus lusitaniae]